MLTYKTLITIVLKNKSPIIKPEIKKKHDPSLKCHDNYSLPPPSKTHAFTLQLIIDIIDI